MILKQSCEEICDFLNKTSVLPFLLSGRRHGMGAKPSHTLQCACLPMMCLRHIAAACRYGNATVRPHSATSRWSAIICSISQASPSVPISSRSTRSSRILPALEGSYHACSAAVAV